MKKIWDKATMKQVKYYMILEKFIFYKENTVVHLENSHNQRN